MTRFAYNTRRLKTAAATASLAFALNLSVSHPAMAACPSAVPTVGDDTLTCNDGNAAAHVDLGDGNDKFVVDGGSMYSGGIAAVGGSRISGDVGNDLIIVKSGEFYDIRGGNTSASTSDIDRIFVFGGNALRAELQSGAGDHPFIFFMGGTIEATTRGSMEIRAGSVGATLVIDGGQLLGNGEFEIQDASGGLNAAEDVTVYFRSGVIETAADGEIEGNSLANKFVFDPINSQNKAFYEGLADDAANGGVASLSTAKLNAALFSNNPNPNKNHLMELRTPEVDLGGGDDTLIFEGAINNGDRRHNLVLQGKEEEPGEFEITEFEGGDGKDTIEVRRGSDLKLGELSSFEKLDIKGGSKLTLVGEDGEGEYEFEDEVVVDATSELHLLGTKFEFGTGDFKLLGGGTSGRLAGLPDYYATFATGGIFRIGALPGAAGEDGDDEDGEEVGEEEDEGGPAHVMFIGDGSTYTNGGTIAMMNGVVGDSLTINDRYVSTGGNLAIDSELGGSGSPTDRLIINGAVAGTTTIYVNNVGGAGALTGQGRGDGIEIVTSGNDAFGANSFRLAANALSGREEVIAGPYAYRLAVTDDAALLQSDILEQVPAYATAPSVGQRLVSTGLDTLYKRLGEIRSGYNDGATSSDGLVWVRGHYSDTDVDAKSGFDFSQRTNGVLFGAGGVIAGEGRSKLMVGGFGGYATADAGVDAIIFGAGSASSVDAESWSFGAYATFYEAGRAGTGLYVDTVVKVDFIDFDMGAAGRGSASADGDAVTGSAEIGYGFALGGGLVLQPQAQLSYTDLAISSFKDAYALDVSYGSSESLVGRLGVQLQANYPQPGGGTISPYALFNVYSEFEGNNRSDVNGVEFASDVGGTWYSAGGGINAQLAGSVSVYGSGEYHFGDVEGWQGTGGVKLNW